jgi:hypothetical protein
LIAVFIPDAPITVLYARSFDADDLMWGSVSGFGREPRRAGDHYTISAGHTLSAWLEQAQSRFGIAAPAP